MAEDRNSAGAGEGAADVPTGGGPGDDLSEALAEREGEPDTPAAAGTGGDPGSPGGMGGVRGGMPNPDHRPNGGVSPIGSEPGDGD